MHKRHNGEGFVQYLERVEREFHNDLRCKIKSRRVVFGPKVRARPAASGHAQTGRDFWFVLELLEKQDRRCYWCCERVVGARFHVDHVHPRSLGGSDEAENLRVACAPCNLSKNAVPPMDFAIKLLRNGS